ncbi:MAG: glycosyltransferase family 39 protein [Anaerolineales bacterium]|nr:glycosyltransferase family 39 protein [Anaerolineales bacterium]
MKKSITRDEWSYLLLFLAIGLGTFLRFHPTMLAGFAINDGGMFAVMVDDLARNKYRLPEFTSYNGLDIPFAYPPLGFYTGRLFSDLFSFGSSEAVRWLPAFFSSLSIPAFYLLASRLLKDKYQAGVAALMYAFMPRAFSWLIMGGGLTRAPGQFFMLLALAAVVRLYQENRRADILFAGLFGGLAVLSHPAAAVQTFISSILLWVMLSRKRAAFINSLFVAALVLLVSLPWWLTALRNHGMTAFANAAQTGGSALALFNLLFFTFTDEPYATLIAAFALIGIVHRFIRRDYLFPLWMALPFLVAGRGAANLAVVPLAMLAAVGLVEVFLPAIQVSPAKEAEGVSSVERGVFIYLGFYLLFSTYQFGTELSASSLSSQDEEAMQWALANTSGDARFLVLTGTTSVACDFVSEWFPAVSGRKSLFTIQGAEWTKGAGFDDYISSTYAVQRCLTNGDMSCVDHAVSPEEYDYIYVSKILRADNCVPLEHQLEFPYFIESLKMDSGFETVYETDRVLISRRK